MVSKCRVWFLGQMYVFSQSKKEIEIQPDLIPFPLWRGARLESSQNLVSNTSPFLFGGGRGWSLARI